MTDYGYEYMSYNVENPVVRDELWPDYFTGYDDDYRDDYEENYEKVRYKIDTQKLTEDEKEIIYIAFKDIEEAGHYEGWFTVEKDGKFIRVHADTDRETVQDIEAVLDEISEIENVAIYEDWSNDYQFAR